MLGRILRAWPRLVAGMGLLSLSMVLAWATGIADAQTGSEQVSAPGGVVLLAISLVIAIFLVVAVPVSVLAALVPGCLGIIELFLIAIFFAIPVTLVRQMIGLPAWIDCFTIAALYLAAYQVFFGSWLDGLGRRDTRTHRACFEVPDPVEAVWSRIAPLPENAGTYYWPKAEFMSPPEGSSADFILHAPRRRGLSPAIDVFRVEALEPGRAVTLLSEPVPGGHGVKERQSLRLTPVGTGTRVELEVTFLDVPLSHRIRLWLGNDAKDFAVSLRNRAQARKDSTVHGRQVLPV